MRCTLKDLGMQFITKLYCSKRLFSATVKKKRSEMLRAGLPSTIIHMQQNKDTSKLELMKIMQLIVSNCCRPN